MLAIYTLDVKFKALLDGRVFCYKKGDFVVYVFKCNMFEINVEPERTNQQELIISWSVKQRREKGLKTTSLVDNRCVLVARTHTQARTHTHARAHD